MTVFGRFQPVATGWFRRKADTQLYVGAAEQPHGADELWDQHVGYQARQVFIQLAPRSPYEIALATIIPTANRDSRAHELTPRLWKEHFAENPLRSDSHELAR